MHACMPCFLVVVHTYSMIVYNWACERTLWRGAKNVRLTILASDSWKSFLVFVFCNCENQYIFWTQQWFNNIFPSNFRRRLKNLSWFDYSFSEQSCSAVGCQKWPFCHLFGVSQSSTILTWTGTLPTTPILTSYYTSCSNTPASIPRRLVISQSPTIRISSYLYCRYSWYS